MNQEFLNNSRPNTKEWWIGKLNVILKDSEYIAIENPTENEKNIVVIKEGSLLPHYIGIKPSAKSNKYSLFTKNDIYKIASEQYEVPQPNRVKGNLPHFNQIDDPTFAFHLAMVLAEDFGWFPLSSEYDPKITKDMWLDFFYNSGKFNDNYKHMMAAMLDIGGQASCMQLAEKYGQNSSHYIMTAVHMAEQAHQYLNCPLFQGDVRDAKLWTVMFKGKQASAKERGTYIWKMRRPLKEAVQEYQNKRNLSDKEGDKMEHIKKQYEKNLVLYGPPGTGKTYSTAIYAVAICDGKSIDELTDYEAVMSRYNVLKKEGRIAFTTFHQSYGYEEFIEGIKPYTNEDSKAVNFSVEPGVFKSFCETAKKKSIDGSPLDISDDARVWKVTIRPNVQKDCFENNRIRINWEYDSNIAVRFVDDITKGDLIITTDGSRTMINGIAVAVDDDAFIMTDADSDRQTRRVKWLATDLSEKIASINAGKQLNRTTVHRVPNMSVPDVIALAAKKNKELSSVEIQKNNKPYVFIIDEINRGNISKIFGELITLIEDTKREGMPEAALAILPYSGESFSVPDNVWLLGTMNTADRSIALMDTALRRRFGFAELMPDADVLRKIGADKVDDLDVAAMLEKINERITFLYDREHTIGHAFFTRLKDEPTLEALSSIFKKSVIPLLQEYFYEDYQKIQLVLGDNAKTDDSLKFIKDEKVNIRQIFKGKADELIDIEKRYTINDTAFDNIESYKQIL